MEPHTSGKTITLLLGHPDPGETLCRSLAEAYREGAQASGSHVSFIDISSADVEFVSSRKNYEAEPSDDVKELQDVIRRSDHLAMVFPMWMGTMPAKTKALIEQIFRPGFGLSTLDGEGFPKRLMKGKSARIIMTMGMPVIAYRLYFKAHGLKNIQRNMLGFCGFDPIRTTLLGGVENMSQDAIKKRIAAVRALGAAGA